MGKRSLNAEMKRSKQGRNTPHGGCATRVWFTKERVLAPHESSVARAPALHDTLRYRRAADDRKLVAPSSESEVAVNRFEGHGARHAFRPKVKG
jgi:hypothetical protein